MGNTHEKAVATVNGIECYRLQFEGVFPHDGITIDMITRAIATFEHAIVSGRAPYDYLAYRNQIESAYEKDEIAGLSEEDAEVYQPYQKAKVATKTLSELVIKGQDLFFSDQANCTAGQAGANFTDEKYHSLGVGIEVAKPDSGRAVISTDAKATGAFKTQTVRNVAMSPPCMHDGSQKTLGGGCGVVRKRTPSEPASQ